MLIMTAVKNKHFASAVRFGIHANAAEVVKKTLKVSKWKQSKPDCSCLQIYVRPVNISYEWYQAIYKVQECRFM